jgi:hypothetical protein
MKSFPLWRVLGVGFLLLLLALGLGGWLVSSRYAQPYVKQLVREQLTHNSELVLAPFEVDFSVWHDFPHLSASLSHLTLTDTTHHRVVPVMRLGRADLRLNLRELLHRRVQVTRLTLHDVAIGQRVDSLGRAWGLRGKKRTITSAPPKIDLALDSIIIYNFGIFTRNDYTHSILRGRIYQARVAATLRQGILAVHGRFSGRLVQLHNRSGDLLTNEPVSAWLTYNYDFAKRQGEFFHTRATLNGDTIHVSGTHTADVAVGDQPPRGTVLNLRFAGSQPLLAVLHAALPPTLQPILRGARSPSKAQIEYLLTGLSGPLVRPRVTLHFGLRNARIAWPDSARRIDRWDLQGTYDNGPAHLPKTMSLNLSQCRIYSPVGQLDMAFLLRDFRNPYVQGRLHGRTELPALMALLSPERWYASRGIADLDVRLHGLLPAVRQLRRGDFRRNLSVRGTATLRNAAFQLNGRQGYLHDLNVRIGLNDSLWRLSNASGVLAGMKFSASATTTYLLDYFTGQHPTTTINGSFAVDELDVSSLRQLLRPTPGSPALVRAGQRPRRSQADRRRIATTLGSHMVPPGMMLDVALRCGRLALATDTLRELAVRIRHDGERVRLTGIRGKLWDGEVRGEAQWLTDSSKRVVPVAYNVDFKFDTLNYKSLLERLTRPPRRSTKSPGSPAIRELLLAANGKLSYEINSLVLPDGQRLRAMRLRFDKQGPILRLPYMYFMMPQGGVGSGSATVQVEGLHIESADASLYLRYPTLDVPQLLQMLASVAPPRTDSAAAAARRALRASRRAARQVPGAAPPSSLIADGRFTALLRVEADHVSYGAVQGANFQLVTHLQAGEAMLDECTVNTLGGRITLRGRLITNAGRQHHPLRVQALLEDIQLPELFGTATSLNLNVLENKNIKGRLRAAVALRTDLDEKFIPNLDNTNAYLKADLRDLELLNVEALQDAFRFFKKRTEHLYFEPVSTEFVLSRGELLIPDLRLNSNLTELQIHGRYDLAGPADLYIGLNPLHAVLGSNNKRISRIQAGEAMTRHDAKLSYVNLTRDAPHTKYRVKIFQKQEQRQAQVALRRQFRQLIITQRLDTTLRLLPGSPFTAPALAAPALTAPVPKLATSP